MHHWLGHGSRVSRGLSSLGPAFNSKLVRGRFVVQKVSSISDFPRIPLRIFIYTLQLPVETMGEALPPSDESGVCRTSWRARVAVLCVHCQLRTDWWACSI